MNFPKIIFTVACVYSSLVLKSQTELHANGQVINNERCIEIKSAAENLETEKQVLSDILEATITDDCLELTIQYGGCGGNIEFVTDGKIVTAAKAKMNFKLVWIEPSTCKEEKQVLVTFDLKPYKKVIQENKAIISIMGTDIQLKYKN
jgi:hypothetical protein